MQACVHELFNDAFGVTSEQTDLGGFETPKDFEQLIELRICFARQTSTRPREESTFVWVNHTASVYPTRRMDSL